MQSWAFLETPFSLYDMVPTLFIGIAGGSGSGKTTLAQALVKALAPIDAGILPLDAYYKGPGSEISPNMYNYDHPQALDSALFLYHLRQLKRGAECCVPVYDFSNHQPSTAKRILRPAPIIIAEGIHVLSIEEIRREMGVTFFVTLTESERLNRRIRRDAVERKRTKQSVVAQFMRDVKPMHDTIVEPSSRSADTIIDGANIDTATVSGLVERLRGLTGF